MNQRPSVKNSTARRLAKVIINGFRSQFADHLNITLAAKTRFEQQDWHWVQKANEERLELYQKKVKQTVDFLHLVTSKDLTDLELWRNAKIAYSRLVFNFPNFEIAETFFNSVFCQIMGHRYVTDDVTYVLSSQMYSAPEAEYDIFIRYEGDNVRDIFYRILMESEFSKQGEDIQNDLDGIEKRFNSEILPKISGSVSDLHFDILESVFYRSKGAYIVGRIVDSNKKYPLVLALLNNKKGNLFVDAALFNSDEMSVVFSFTRNHFMVDAPLPYLYANFIREILPNKQYYEIYNSLGFPKHAKTEFWRGLVKYMRSNDDKFIIAPGIKGMVMTVFLLPGHNMCFKIIKDKFAPPKEVTEEIVRAKYRLVSRHDRIGRMADTEEFDDLVLPLDKFAPELIAELEAVCPSKIKIDREHNQIEIAHVYAERYMTPLNIYLETATDEQICNVMNEYGSAIKQLAAANIFPGDMPLKNWGVTRHGRIVFYDYDEIAYLTECNFRTIPQPRTEEEELSGSTWYTVADEDVFPEEFRLFFSGKPKARKYFEQFHSDLYTVEFWQGLQEQIRGGYIPDIFPYPEVCRIPQLTAETLEQVN